MRAASRPVALRTLRVASRYATRAILGLLGVGTVAGAQAADKLYVVNQAGATISVIDQQRLAVDTVLDLRTLGFTANAKPHHVAVENDGSFWYVSLIGDGRVLKFDRNNRLVGQVALETPGQRRIYLVYPPRNADSPKVAAFRAWIKAEIAADARG
ncbi:MAG TPA: hypothetical protein PKE51_09550 [Gemmatimonadaceae bacterium]|nr:hypothetical protein [Gemmatimonadaceae bacterium]